MIRVTREDLVLTASERFAIEESISECAEAEFESLDRVGCSLGYDDRFVIIGRAVELWKRMPALVGDAKVWCCAICNDALDIGRNERVAASILLAAIEKFEGEHR